jgi:hypothetical protein
VYGRPYLHRAGGCADRRRDDHRRGTGRRHPSRSAASSRCAVPISLGVQGAFVALRFGTLSMSTAHRYSF